MEKKTASETVTLEFPYADEIGAATISSAVVTNYVESGTDNNPSLMMLGSPSPSGTSVFQLYKLGILGNVYRAQCVATLSDGRKLERDIFTLIGYSIP